MKKLLLLIIIFIVISIIGFSLYLLISNNRKASDQSFKLVSVSPNNYSQDVNVDTEIKFEFSKTLSRKETSNTLEVIPASYLTKDIVDNEIIFKPNTNLKENTQYTIKLSNIESINGEQISPITLIFTTGKDNSLRAQFIKSLPIQGDGFYIKYDETINTFIVTIQKNPYDKYKQNAIDYLTSKGINTNSEKIKYEQLRYLQGNGAPPG